jgi:hypothetical protein
MDVIHRFWCQGDGVSWIETLVATLHIAHPEKKGLKN